MSDHNPSPTLSPAERQRTDRTEDLVEAGAAEVPALLAKLAEPGWAVRRRVVATLAKLGDAAAEPLCELLRTRRDDEARIAAAVDALSASTGAGVDHAVLALAESPEPAVVTDAAQILGRRRSAAGIPTLARLTQHPDDNVAVAAIEALGRVGCRAAVDLLIAAVRSGNFFRTFPAIDILGRSGDPRAVSPLAALLGDASYAHEAARALGRTGDKNAVEPLLQVLTRPSDAMVRVAAVALAELHDRHVERHGVIAPFDRVLRASSSSGAVRRLIHAFAGADAAEQAAICRALGALGEESAVPFLMRCLDAPLSVASAAAEALKKLGRESDVELLSALLEGDSARRQVLLPLVAARSSAVAAVVLCLADPSPHVRASACDVLARIGDPAAVPALFARLADPSALVVHAAVGAIQSLGSAETEARTLAAARSPEPQVRRAAFRMIAYFGYRSALDLLLAAIHGDDEPLRDSAIHALPFLSDPRALEALLSVGRHEDARARAAAMRALGQCQDEPGVVACLTGGLSDPDAWVRYYACQSLGKLAWEPAVERVAALLQDPAGQVRVAAVEALSHLRSGVAFAALSEAVAAEEPDMQRAALVGLGLGKRPESLPLLIASLSSREPATRIVAVSSIAGFDAPEVVPALRRAATDGDEGVRTAAVGFLAACPTVEATRALIDLMGEEPLEARILAALSVASEGRINGIVAALSTSDDELSPRLTSALARMHRPDAAAAVLSTLSLANVPARKAAAATLGAFGTPEAVEALRRAAAADPDLEVRRICSLALSE